MKNHTFSEAMIDRVNEILNEVEIQPKVDAMAAKLQEEKERNFKVTGFLYD